MLRMAGVGEVLRGGGSVSLGNEKSLKSSKKKFYLLEQLTGES